MGQVQDLLDRLTALRSGRVMWEKHWLDVARYTLPDAERFDGMFSSGSTWGNQATAIDSVVSAPIAAERSREIYDQTSLWAVDRGAAGTLSLVFPQTETWLDLVASDPFAPEPSDEQKRWYEGLRDYIFTTRANPRSGYWTSRKAAMRALWAFGTAVRFIEESDRGVSSPISYRYVALSECYLGCDYEGNIDTNFRVFSRSAKQCVQRWGTNCSAKTQAMAGDEKRKDQTVTILHAVYPRDEKGSYRNSNKSSPFASCYIEIDEKHLIGESGFFEFPYVVDHWQRNNPGPYAEGPVALALAEVKSANMLAKEELKAVQQWVAPPYATTDDGMGRLNLNPRAANPGYLSAQGELLAKPITMMQRPDFARMVIEARTKGIEKTMYLPLWTAILDSQRQMTAEEVFVKNQERADQLGTVGSSVQVGASYEVDREISILERRGAFKPGSALAAPESAQGKGVGVRFSSPLDRLRKSGELQGLQSLWTFGANIAQAGHPEALEKLDADRSIEFAREVLGAPIKVMATPAELAAKRQQSGAMAATGNGIAAAKGAGDAAQSAAAGATAIASSPAASAILQKLAGAAGIPAQ